MKVLHVSDLHIGKRVNGMSMLDDQRYILRQILDIAEKRQVSVLLIAGDVYDKASPSAEAVTVFDAFLTDAVAADLRVLAIPGNHDVTNAVGFYKAMTPAKDNGSLLAMYNRANNTSLTRRGCWKSRACACLRSTRAKLSGWNLRMSTGQWSSGCCRF